MKNNYKEIAFLLYKKLWNIFFIENDNQKSLNDVTICDITSLIAVIGIFILFPIGSIADCILMIIVMLSNDSIISVNLFINLFASFLLVPCVISGISILLYGIINILSISHE